MVDRFIIANLSGKSIVIRPKKKIVCFRKTAWGKMSSPGRPRFHFFANIKDIKKYELYPSIQLRLHGSWPHDFY